MISEIRSRIGKVEEAILALEQYSFGGARRRGRPPASVKPAKRRGRPPGSKNKAKAAAKAPAVMAAGA